MQVELHSTAAVVVLVVVVVNWFTTLTVEGCFLRGKLPLFLLFVFYTVIPGSGSTTGDYKGIKLDVGSKENRL